MGFKAEEVIDKLDYDFKPIIKGQRAVGVIPEPSSDQIESLAKLISEFMPTDAEGKIDMKAMEEKMSEEDAEDRLIAGISAFTSGKINEELLREVSSKSPRMFRAFMGWLVGKFYTSPEA